MSAQEIHGVAVDPDGQPVEAVTITVRDAAGDPVARTASDASGRFQVALPGPGRYTVTAERVSYAPATTSPVAVQRGEAMEVMVRLSIEPVELATIEVRVRPVALTRVGETYNRIELHRRAGIGRSLTREEIEERAAPTVPALVATMSPLVRTANPLHGPEVIALRSARRRPVPGLEGISLTICEPSIYIDGVYSLGSIDPAMLAVEDIEAVELYLGMEAPVMYPDRTDCGGVVLFWTRAGLTEGAPRLTLWRAMAGGALIAAVLLVGLGAGL